MKFLIFIRVSFFITLFLLMGAIISCDDDDRETVNPTIEMEEDVFFDIYNIDQPINFLGTFNDNKQLYSAHFVFTADLKDGEEDIQFEVEKVIPLSGTEFKVDIDEPLEIFNKEEIEEQTDNKVLPGDYTLIIVCRDAAMNLSEPIKIEFKITDESLPIISNMIPEDEAEFIIDDEIEIACDLVSESALKKLTILIRSDLDEGWSPDEITEMNFANDHQISYQYLLTIPEDAKLGNYEIILTITNEAGLTVCKRKPFTIKASEENS